jgi:mono/diheme cytochrome c family protein
MAGARLSLSALFAVAENRMRHGTMFSATLLVLATSTAVGQNVSRGEQVVKQKCDNCHTLRDDKKEPVVGLLAGGKIMGGAASANLTPDPSGISYYDEKLFLGVVRTGQVRARKLKPVMNPTLLKSLSDDELRDAFAYLRSVPAVKHRIDNTEPPTECRLCRQKHGAGDSN